MSEIDKQYEDLQIKESDIKTKFSLHGHNFWVRKGTGQIRKKIPAASFIEALITDKVGMMSGKYDDTIEYLMAGVVCNAENGPIDLSGDNYWEWASGLEGITQLQILADLPAAVASVIVGKSKMKALIQRAMTSNESMQSLESSNISKEPKQKVSAKKSKKPVRNLPKTTSSG